MALADSRFATGVFSYSSWHVDWGLKGQTYIIDFIGDQFETSSKQYVRYMDVIIYRTPSYAIWPPDIGNGTAMHMKTQLINTSGTAIATESDQYWNNGAYNSYMFPGGTLIFEMRKKYEIQASPAGVYKIRATGRHVLPSDTWMPTYSEKYVETTYF